MIKSKNLTWILNWRWRLPIQGDKYSLQFFQWYLKVPKKKLNCLKQFWTITTHLYCIYTFFHSLWTLIKFKIVVSNHFQRYFLSTEGINFYHYSNCTLIYSLLSYVEEYLLKIKLKAASVIILQKKSLNKSYNIN